MPAGIWKTVSIVGENSQDDEYQPDLKQRGGSIIPLAQLVQSTVDYKLDSVTLFVCPDKNSKAEGQLYNDEGEGFEYKNGEFEITHFTAEKTNDRSITVTCEHNGGNLSRPERYYRIALITDSVIVYSGWEQKDKLKISLP